MALREDHWAFTPLLILWFITAISGFGLGLYAWWIVLFN